MHADGLPVPDGLLSDEELNRFMVNRFSLAVQEAMSAQGVETITDSERLLTESELVVCIQGRAFAIGEDYSVSRAADGIGKAHGVAIAGSGWKFALGAFHAVMGSCPPDTPEQLANMLVEAAIYWDQACGGPIVTLHQERA